MMHRHEGTIHHYIQKNGSKQIQRKKMMWHFIGSKIKPTKYQLAASQKTKEKLCMRNRAAKLTFIILKFNVTFINKSHADTERRAD